MTPDDLIVAFFPCIYFCEKSMASFALGCRNYRKLNDGEKVEKILERESNRNEFYTLLVQLVGVCLKKGLRIIIENPWSQPHFLYMNFLKQPTIVDKDRTRRGDYFKKPTAYWFFNCENTTGFTWQQDKQRKSIMNCKGGASAGLCSEERSMISPDYARNFICDFILGKPQNIGVGNLFT